MERMGKQIVWLGVAIVCVGLVIWLAGDKLKFLGRLPGDIRIERDNFRVFIPITTMLLLSGLLSLILWLVQKFR
jgi:hypothetical protein